MSLTSYIGTERNILEETPQHCHTLKLPHPDPHQLGSRKTAPRQLGRLPGHHAAHAVPRRRRRHWNCERSLDALCRRASLAIKSGYTLLILSDRGMDDEYAPIPSLLALTAVHNHLVREGTRTQVALIIESGEPREVMHFACSSATAPAPSIPTSPSRRWKTWPARGMLPDGVTIETALKNYKKAINKGLLKVFSKMGISTLQSYRGAQIFEAIGLNKSLVDKYFTGTPSRIEGVGLDVLAQEARMKHSHAFRPVTRLRTRTRYRRQLPLPRQRRVSPREPA